MPSKSTLLKISIFASLGTAIACLVDGLLWDFAPFNRYQGMFWISFLPLILFFMKENQDRKYLVNMWLSYVCGLIWGLLALGAIVVLSQGAGLIAIDLVVDFLICGLIVFVHNELLGKTPFNAVACVFLGFATTLACMTTSFPIWGELVAPTTLNGLDMLVIFTWGILVTFFLSWLCEKLIGVFVFKGTPAPEAPADSEQAGTQPQGATR